MGHFRRDDRVSHARYGAGLVIDIDERYTTIAFDDSGVRKFVTKLVQLERSDLPLPVKPPPPPRRRSRRHATAAASTTEHNDS